MHNVNRKAPTLTVVLFCFLTALPSAQAQSVSSKLEQYMDAQVNVNRFSGAALVARDGKVLFSRGYGPSELKPGVSDTNGTRFRIGSIAMQFADLAVLQLEAKGKLRVQDSVCKYIKHCPGGWQPITLFELMIHTSGIPELPPEETAGSGNPSASQLSDRIKREPLRFKPDERLDPTYSEDDVLNAVIEVVSGEDHSSYFRKHIFVPLQMRDTGYGYSNAAPSATAPLLVPSDVRLSIGHIAGSLYSTVEDLYRWDRALKTRELVPTQLLGKMFTPYRDGYGLGWVIQKQLNRKVYTQGGGIRTYSSAILRYPDDDACVVVLSQLDTTDAQKIGKDLAAIVLGSKYELPVERKAIRLDPGKLDDYVGRFALTPPFVLSVTKDGDRLRIQGAGQSDAELLPESETQFFVAGSDVRIQFVKPARGRATELVLQQGGRDIPARRIN